MNILEMVAKQLHQIFPRATIYRDPQRAGSKVPSFYISNYETTRTPQLFGRQKRHYNYQLTYFPEPEDEAGLTVSEQLERMQEALLDEFLELPEFATFRNVDFNVSDGALVMTFTVMIRATPVNRDPWQEVASFKATTKRTEE